MPSKKEIQELIVVDDFGDMPISSWSVRTTPWPGCITMDIAETDWHPGGLFDDLLQKPKHESNA